MTQNEKDLLLKDLCARLPYGVICQYDTIVPIVGKVKSYDKLRAISEFDNKPCFQFNCNRDIFDFDNVRPYLFPLSSMTEEKIEELLDIVIPINNGSCIIEESNIGKYMEWCYKNHLDVNDLIPKGLANDATGKKIY